MSSVDLQRTLDTIPSTSPILFFPLRLETCFDGPKKLKVRIIPDEILLRYPTDFLTKTHSEEGKRFWIQWFIASGDAKSEFQAWRNLCNKYGVHHAGRIALLTRPINLDAFRLGGDLFRSRPYAIVQSDGKVVNIYDLCDSIYEELSKIDITANSPATVSFTGVPEALNKISISLSSISTVLDLRPSIVDSFYDKIRDCVRYLTQRLEGIGAFYEKFPKYKNNKSVFDTVDKDYYAYCQLRDQVARFTTENEKKAITLEDMVNQYLNDTDFDKEFFPKTLAVNSESYGVPKASYMPNSFIFTGYAKYNDGTAGRIIVESKPFDQSVAMGADLLTSSDPGFMIDESGNMIVPDNLKWMVDYDEAEKCGLAITVNLSKECEKMDYVYVFGVREKSVWDHTHIQTLFKGHSYWNDGLSLVPTGTPTNDIDGFRKVESPSEEEMIELKYKLEILEEGRNRKRNSDAVEMCEYLGISYEDSNFSRAINQDKEDLHDFYIAAQVLWSHFINQMFSDIMEPVAQGDDLVKYLAEFFQPYVNARGLFPVFRIGDQPYGIVPVTDFENLKFSISNLSGAYLRMFYDTALAIGKRWTEIKNYNPLCAETLKGSTSNKRFFEMMAQTPHSMSVSNRFYYTGDGPVKKNKEDIWLLDMLDKMGLYGAVPVKDSSVKYDISELVDSVKKALPHLDDWNAESLVYEFMDVFTYRIDAWYTAMVKYCLDKNIAITGRSNTPAIGCFGWVFDLEYGTRNKTDEKGEFILAPSVQHALTAAVLRSSYLQTKGDTLDSHMCINLSSMRARQALRMLDGIKSGMSTGLILGADLERYLHDAYKVQKREMDKYIYPLRRLFPQTVDIKAEDKRAEDYNLQVINGESLLNSILPKWDNKGKLSEWMKSHATELPWFNALVKESGMPTSDKLVLFNLIERILDSYDALNDLLLAEGVHRLVAGDKSSYAAISNFMSKGSGNLPSPAILDTPVEYVVVSQKVGFALPHVELEDLNEDESRSILVKADPSVNAWLNAQIGSMDCLFFYVDYCNKNGERNFFRTTLQEIGIKPVEYLQMTKNSNIREIILELMWRQARSKYDGTVRILTGDPEDLKVGEILPENNYLLAMSLYEFDLVAESLSGILSRSRELRASDIFPNYLNDSNEEDFMDIEELKSRYCSVFTQMTGLLGDMKTVANSLEGKPYATDKQLVVMYKLMTHCACAGMYNEVIPFDSSLFVSDLDLVYQRHMFDKGLEKQKKFFEQFVSATLVLEDKISKAKEIADPDSDMAYASSEYIDAVRELTLKDLRVICHFDLNKYSGEITNPFMYGPYAALAENYLNSGNFKEDALNEWISEISEVRPGMHLLQQLRMLNSCRGSLLPRTGVGIYQTLAGDGANKKYSSEWLGWKVSSEAVLNDADSLILFNNENFNRMRCNSGLVMDSWLEYIPYRKQTAGMVFRCDVPDAEAPQALLLAVHPECGLAKQSKWTGSHIFNILQSAKELMQIRTVDPDLIAKSKYSLSGSLLPGRKNFKLDRKKFVMIDKTIKSYAESNEIYKKAKDEGILTKGNEGYIPGGIF